MLGADVCALQVEVEPAPLHQFRRRFALRGVARLEFVGIIFVGILMEAREEVV